MKYIVPLVIAVLLIASVFALFKFKGLNKPEDENRVSVVQEQAVDGSPDGVVEAILQSAESEAGSTVSEDDESADVGEDVNQLSQLGDVYNDSEY